MKRYQMTNVVYEKETPKATFLVAGKRKEYRLYIMPKNSDDVLEFKFFGDSVYAKKADAIKTISRLAEAYSAK